MWNKRALTVLCSLTLAGSMAVPAFAADGVLGQTNLSTTPYASVVAEGPAVTAGEDLLTRAERVSALHQNGENQFGPEDPVTREQMALILNRYAQNNDQGFTGAWAFPLGYSDASQISEYAYEAVCWMTMKEVMGEKDEHAFAPQSTVTQQEADSMLTQYFTVLEQAEIQ